MRFGWAIGALCFLALASEPSKHFTSLQRLDESRLEAVRQARLEWSRSRVVYPQLGLYRDFRAILHVHAEDSKHTLGTREQVLRAARDTGVDVIMWTDHDGPKPGTWEGFREGVLFIPGAESDHQLRYPGGLKFLAHPEEVPNAPTNDVVGMEIYNRHSDAKAHPEFSHYIEHAETNGGEWRKLASRESRYPDEVFAAGTDRLNDFLARYDREIAKRRFTAIAGNDAHRNQVFNGVVFDSYEVAFRQVSTHILAQELKPELIRQSLAEGHAYIAHDWLCDPNGFSYVAMNNLGVFDMGDRVPMIAGTELVARFPIKAHVRLIHKGNVIADSTTGLFTFKPEEEGAYRLEASLRVAGEDRPWIYSNPLYLYRPAASELAMPPSTLADNVKAVRNVEYAAGKPEDADKHKLDLYLPVDRTRFPVMLFVHGGSWRTGDRSIYGPVGNRFAKMGIGVVIPSYRLAPKNPPPAQIEDVAAAFDWTVRHISEYGGDPHRLFVAGHSAGGHLVSLLALDPRYLKTFNLSNDAIRGVISLSGVYDVRNVELFGPDEAVRRGASPIQYVTMHAPPFLLTYCQWDYSGLPAQAREFDRALRHAFAASTLRYIPNENHISEIVHLCNDDDPTAREMLEFMDSASH